MLIGDDDDGVAAMKTAVKEMNFGGREEKEAAATEIKRLARNEDMKRTLAELGVIPALVAMLVESKGDDDGRSRRTAVAALLEMANGSFRNKKSMVEAGLLSKLPHLLHTESLIFDKHFAHLLYSISSLVKTQYPIASCRIIPFVVETLNTEKIHDEIKLTSLSTLHNLSTKLENTKLIATSSAVHALLISSTYKMASEVALAILCNLILSSTGKQSIEDDPLVPEIFIQILTWDEKPICQELASYLLMIIAHKSITQRKTMKELGVVPILLELALLGSSLSRKRALKLLQWLKDEKEMSMRVHSGPQARGSAIERDGGKIEESRRAVKRIVKQSLDMNMESIMRRALVACSSSNSLPC